MYCNRVVARRLIHNVALSLSVTPSLGTNMRKNWDDVPIAATAIVCLADFRYAALSVHLLPSPHVRRFEYALSEVGQVIRYASMMMGRRSIGV
jgi:hypothetical protein